MPRYYIGNIPCGKADLAHHGVKGMEWGKHKFGIDANTKYINWWSPSNGIGAYKSKPHLVSNNAGTAPRSSVAVGGGSAHPLKDQIKVDNQKKQQRQAARSNTPRMVGQLQQIATNQRKAESWNQKHPGNGPAPIYGDDAAARLANDRIASQTRFMNSQQQMALSKQQNDPDSYNAQNQQAFAENFRNSPAMKGQVAANIAYDSVNPRGGVAGYFGGDAERANAAAANARAEQNPTERNKALANEANQALAKYESGIRPTIYNAGSAVGNAVGTAANNVGEYLSRDAVDQRYADYLANRGYPSSTSNYNDQALADYQYAHGQYNPQYQGFNGISSIPGVIGNNARELATTVGSRIQGGLGNAYDAVTDIGGRIGTSIANTAGNVGNWIGQRANDVGNWFGGVGNTIGNAARGVGDWVGGAVNNVGNWIGGVGNTIGNAAQGVGNWVGNRVANIGDFANRAGDWVGNAASNVGGWIGDRAADVQNWWTGDRDRQVAFDNLSNAMRARNAASVPLSSGPANTLAMNRYQNAVNNVASAQQAWEDAQNAGFRNRLIDAGNWIAGVPGAVGSWAGGVANDVGNWARGVPGSVSGWTEDRVADVRNMWTGDRDRQVAFNNLNNLILGGGSPADVNSALQAWNGAQNAGVGNYLTNTANNIGNGVNEMFGLGSNSTVANGNYYLPLSAYNLPASVSTDINNRSANETPYVPVYSGSPTPGYMFEKTDRLRHDSLAIGKTYKGSCIVKDISYRR